MTITESVRARIRSALERKGMSYTELAQALGYQKPWATRLFNGTLQTMNEETVKTLENLLEIEFFRITRSNEAVSGLGFEISRATAESADLLRTVESVLELYRSGGKQAVAPDNFSKDQVEALGEKIIRLVQDHGEQPCMIGRKTLELVGETLT